ncbi:MAG: hypothetical protein JSV42_10835 [Chloroflexota bacterium]|nr:MAG: hypothetical protein JSV42_10835 [Chloroflexota bacterium]
MNIFLITIKSKIIWIWEVAVLVVFLLLLSSCSSADGPVATATLEMPTATMLRPQATATVRPAPTATPTNTNTPVPSATKAPTSTPTQDIQATADAEATQMIESSMDSIRGDLEMLGFPEDSGNLGWVQEGSETIFVEDYDSGDFKEFAEDLEAGNFILGTDVTWESSSGLAGCGLLFRSEANLDHGSHYELAFLRLSGLPAWNIIYIKDGEFQKNVTGVVTAAAINQDQGGTNSYLLVAEEGKFTIYINEQRIGSYFDYALSRETGKFAFTGWQESGETRCSYENSWVWLLD